jgi:hypothetical protein
MQIAYDFPWHNPAPKRAQRVLWIPQLPVVAFIGNMQNAF